MLLKFYNTSCDRFCSKMDRFKYFEIRIYFLINEPGYSTIKSSYSTMESTFPLFTIKSIFLLLTIKSISIFLLLIIESRSTFPSLTTKSTFPLLIIKSKLTFLLLTIESIYNKGFRISNDISLEKLANLIQKKLIPFIFI